MKTWNYLRTNSVKAFLSANVISAMIVSCMIFLLCILPGNAWGEGVIKLGHMQPLSGMMAEYGKLNSEGLDLAVEEINKAGGLLGKKVTVVRKDTHASPQAAIKEARKLILEDDVSVIIGTSSSSVAKAVSQIAAELKVPYIITDAQTPDVVGKDCNRFTFRSSDDLIQINRAAAKAVIKHIGVPKRLACIGSDYIFGHQTWEYFKETILAANPQIEIVAEVFPPFKVGDYRAYITTLINAKPDVVFSSLWSGNLITFIKQAKGFGFFKAIPTFINTSGSLMDVSEALGDNMVTIWGVDRYYCEYPKTKMNQKFVADYKARFRHLPKATSGEAYGAALAYFEAVKKCGSIVPEKVVSALEALVWNTPEGEKYMRPQDHQAVQEHVLFGKIGPGKKLPYWGYEKIFSIPGKEVIVPIDQIECKR